MPLRGSLCRGPRRRRQRCGGARARRTGARAQQLRRARRPQARAADDAVAPRGADAESSPPMVRRCGVRSPTCAARDAPPRRIHVRGRLDPRGRHRRDDCGVHGHRRRAAARTAISTTRCARRAEQGHQCRRDARVVHRRLARLRRAKLLVCHAGGVRVVADEPHGRRRAASPPIDHRVGKLLRRGRREAAARTRGRGIRRHAVGRARCRPQLWILESPVRRESGCRRHRCDAQRTPGDGRRRHAARVRAAVRRS